MQSGWFYRLCNNTGAGEGQLGLGKCGLSFLLAQVHTHMYAAHRPPFFASPLHPSIGARLCSSVKSGHDEPRGGSASWSRRSADGGPSISGAITAPPVAVRPHGAGATLFRLPRSAGGDDGSESRRKRACPPRSLPIGPLGTPSWRYLLLDGLGGWGGRSAEAAHGSDPPGGGTSP